MAQKERISGNTRIQQPFGYFAGRYTAVKLKHLDIWIERRRNNAALYSSLLDRLPGIITPFVAEYGKHSFNYYNLRITSGAAAGTVGEVFIGEGISCGVYYLYPCICKAPMPI